jgi:hypothetical protein
MVIGKGDASGCKLGNIRRVDFAAKWGNIREAKVVCEYENNIGPGLTLSNCPIE